jgi:hypothetical protein
MESISRLEIEYGDFDKSSAWIDFFRDDDGNLTYEIVIRSVAGTKDPKMVVPAADIFSLVQWLATRVVTWDRDTLSDEFGKWKDARNKAYGVFGAG